MNEPKPSFSTTYKRADGEHIGDEYGWVTDLDFFDDDEEPAELIEEVWVRQSVRTFWHMPDRFYHCQASLIPGMPDCDEDAEVWWQSAAGNWWQLCKTHQSLGLMAQHVASIPGGI